MITFLWLLAINPGPFFWICWQHKSQQYSCVFWPANWCFACRLLVEIIFQSFWHFSIFSWQNNEIKRKKRNSKTWKRGLPAFRCYSSMLVDTQTLVDSWKKYNFSLFHLKMSEIKHLFWKLITGTYELSGNTAQACLLSQIKWWTIDKCWLDFVIEEYVIDIGCFQDQILIFSFI